MKIFNFNSQNTDNTKTCKKYVPGCVAGCKNPNIEIIDDSWRKLYYCCGGLKYIETVCNAFEEGSVGMILPPRHSGEKCKSEAIMTGFNGAFIDVYYWSGWLIHCGDAPVAVSICSCMNPKKVKLWSGGTKTIPERTNCITVIIPPGPYSTGVMIYDKPEWIGRVYQKDRKFLGHAREFRAGPTRSSTGGVCYRSNRFNVNIVKKDMKLIQGRLPGCRPMTGDTYTGNSDDYGIPQEATCPESCQPIISSCTGDGGTLEINITTKNFAEDSNPKWYRDFQQNIPTIIY